MQTQFKEEKYHIVTETQARKNVAYWSVVQYLFPTNKSAKKKSLIELSGETKACEYAALVQAGNLEKLDFSDRNFHWNILQALRLKKINVDQTATAFFLYEVKKLSLGPVRRSLLSNEACQHLPDAVRCYYSLNFSKKIEVAYLYAIIQRQLKDYELGCYRVWKENDLGAQLLKLYFQRLPSNFDKQRLEEYFKILCSPENHLESAKAAARFLRVLQLKENEILSQLPYFADPDAYYANRDNNPEANLEHDSIEILILITRKLMPFPSLSISPDYKPQDPKSPLLAFNIPHMTALQMMLKAIDPERACLPSFTLSNNPALKDLKQYPVKLYVPGLTENENLDGIIILPFVSMWRDLYDIWRMNRNTVCEEHSFTLDESKREVSASTYVIDDHDENHWQIHCHDNDAIELQELPKHKSVSPLNSHHPIFKPQSPKENDSAGLIEQMRLHVLRYEGANSSQLIAETKALKLVLNKMFLGASACEIIAFTLETRKKYLSNLEDTVAAMLLQKVHDYYSTQLNPIRRPPPLKKGD